MNIYMEHVERDFTALLQKNIQFVHRDKVLKEGRLVLFAIKDFYLDFQLLPNNSTKMVHFEIPYPFKYTNNPDHLVLSYLEEYFTKRDPEVEHSILFYFIKNPSKYYNSEVTIRKI